MNAGLPSIYLFDQDFRQDCIGDIAGAVREELARIRIHEVVKKGSSVAVTAGSRGIKNIDIITAAVVDFFQKIDACPFIVPAMGSHGGGTAEGQKDILTSYGITGKSMGCEIKSSMDTVRIGTTSLGTTVFLDRYASEADHIFVVNRIKPHTKLSGDIESGLVKMCMIGLGKREGAATYHRAIERHSWMEIVHSVVDVLLDKKVITAGLGIVQNAREEIAKIEAMLPEDFLKRESSLLTDARTLMGILPFNDIDLLIVDEMGKEISGTGMDTVITGRKENSPYRVTRVFVRDLTDETKGNAQGIGLADLTTRRLVNKIDFNKLYINSQTAFRTDTCKIPMTFENDREALEVAVKISGIGDPAGLRLAWIINTLDLGTIAASYNLLETITETTIKKSVRGPLAIEFDREGFLISPLKHL